jgi:hypothetical protein
MEGNQHSRNHCKDCIGLRNIACMCSAADDDNTADEPFAKQLRVSDADLATPRALTGL